MELECVGKLNLVNFRFTLLNEDDIAMSARGNHTIAILNVPEDYEKLAIALRDVIAKVKTLTLATINLKLNISYVAI